MSGQQSPLPPPEFSPETPPAPAVWPKVIGIIAIVFGSAGVLMNIVTAFFPLMQRMLPPEAQAAQGITPEFIERWGTYQIVSPIVMAAIALILLVGGIQLLRRRRKSRSIIYAWSVVKLIAGAVGAWIGAKMQADIFANLREVTDGPEAEIVNSMTSSVGSIALVIGIIWIALLPVFMLIWFSLPATKREVARWS